MNRSLLYASVLIMACVFAARGQEAKNLDGVHARLEVSSRFVDVGRPIWARFVIENHTDDPVSLAVQNKARIPTDMTAEIGACVVGCTLANTAGNNPLLAP